MKTYLPILSSVVLSSMSATASPRAPGASGNVLASGYGSDLVFYSLTDGVLSREGSQIVDPNLTWMEQEGESFFATHETNDFEGESGGAISRWEMESGQLVRREHVSLQSNGPAHFILDLDHNLAITANYGGGSVTVVTLEDGQLGAVIQKIEYEACRDNSHPHQIVRKGDLVWVVDLGCDSIYHYRINGNQLERTGETVVEDGAGPRHMVLHPTDNLAFLVWELKSAVEVYAYDGETGDLLLLQKLPFSSTDSDVGAEILVGPTTPKGPTVYATSRGSGIVAVYQLDSTGAYELTQEFNLEGSWPRSIAIKEDIMLAIDKVGGTIQVVYIGQSGPMEGKLSAGPVLEAFSGVAYVMFYD